MPDSIKSDRNSTNFVRLDRAKIHLSKFGQKGCFQTIRLRHAVHRKVIKQSRRFVFVHENPLVALQRSVRRRQRFIVLVVEVLVRNSCCVLPRGLEPVRHTLIFRAAQLAFRVWAFAAA